MDLLKFNKHVYLLHEWLNSVDTNTVSNKSSTNLTEIASEQSVA